MIAIAIVLLICVILYLKGYIRLPLLKEHFQASNTCVDPTVSPFPTGMIIIWNGSESNVPIGWGLCNGQNGTPDLRGRFVLGFNPADGITGRSKNRLTDVAGEERVTLSLGQMPKHQHWYTEGGEYRVCSGCQEHEVGDNPWDRLWWQNTTEVGNNESHNNMPPYYVLAYIIKL